MNPKKVDKSKLSVIIVSSFAYPFRLPRNRMNRTWSRHG
jgi:hypothetical protein